MKPESLEALGAKPLDPEIAARLGLADHFDLGEFREQLPEIIGDAARVIADNPLQFAFLLSADYVVGQAVVNLVKPRGIFGVAACGIVSYAACTLIAAELMKRGLIKIKLRDLPDDDGCECGGHGHERVPEDLTVRQVYERGGHYDPAANEFVVPEKEKS